MLKKMSIYFLILLLFVSFLLATMFIYGAPIELNMGVVQKIFYFHMPSAVISMFLFFLSFIFSIVFLIKKSDIFDSLAYVCVEIAVFLSSYVLISGPLWAKKAWGAYWVWDARLTFTLIMWLIYISYLIVRNSKLRERKKNSAIISIFGFLDVPLVHYSVNKWGGIHPELKKGLKESMPQEMLNTLYVSFMFILILSIVLFIMRYFILKNKKELEKLEYQILYKEAK